MKTALTRISPIAAAIALAFGSSVTLAQQADEEIQNERPEAAAQQEQDREQARQGSEQAQAQSQANRSENPGSSDFGQIAEQHSDLGKFVEAVNTAGLGDALAGGTEYTIFAPTDAALEEQDIESLLEPENRQELIKLLRAHIVADDLDPELASEIQQARTLDGATIEVSMEGEKMMIGGVEATEAKDVNVGNLRVYSVDQVLGQGQEMPADAEDRQAANRPDSESEADSLQ